jgi:hypothetical protein
MAKNQNQSWAKLVDSEAEESDLFDDDGSCCVAHTASFTELSIITSNTLHVLTQFGLTEVIVVHQ